MTATGELNICTYADTAPHGCGKVAHAWGYDERGRDVRQRVCSFCPDQLGVAARVRRADKLRAAAADAVSVTALARAPAAAVPESTADA